MPAFAFSAPEGFDSNKMELPVAGTKTEWIIARDREILLPLAPGNQLPADPPELGYVVMQELGRLGETAVKTAAVGSGTAAPEGWGWFGLRSLYGVLEDSRLSLAGRAVQVLDWKLSNAFCGRCGAQTEFDEREHCLRCAPCKSAIFPRIEPAVIVAVTRAPNEILLARSSRLPSGVHSVLAGFVEPGETLEQCAEREVEEETNIRIKNVRYFASQPWPFPRSLMVGFVAEYASGSIQVDRRELESAGWFELDALPPLPSSLSIARGLIEHVRTQSCSSHAP